MLPENRHRANRWIGSFGLLLLFPCCMANATDYYLSRQTGIDRGNGLSPETPWKSVAKVNRTVFHPGDRVLFHTGESWPEELRPRSSGTPEAPIVFTSYGSGARPVLDGEPMLDGGEDENGAIRTRTQRIGVQSRARDVAVDNNEQSHIVYDSLEFRHVLEGVRVYSWSAAVEDVTIQNCYIQTDPAVPGRDASAGVYANTKSGIISGLHIRANHFTPHPKRLNHWGIYLVSGVSNFLIEDNTLDPSGEDAITIWHSAYGEILRNRGGGNGENTIDVKDSHDILIRDNDADLDREYNIVVHSVDAPTSTYNVRVEHNRCLRGGQGGELTAGVALLFVQKSGVEDNVIDFAYGSGILIKDASPNQRNWASGNRLTGNGTGQKLPAIVLQGNSTASLDMNQIQPLAAR